ncbi:MAG: electron transfer flavoprotein subunit beta/FixA family protein [Pseudomonadota bacterium]
MNIIVLIKQVPNTTQVKLDPRTGNLIREGLESIANPDDLHAVEAAVLLKDRFGGTVTAVSMGRPQAVDVLTQAMGMGADRAILLSDPAFAGADTWATSLTLSRAIQTIGGFDLVLCGHQAIDGDTAQIGPQVADWLDIAQATYVMDIEDVSTEEIIVKRRLDNGFEQLACRLPALITVIRDLNTPRFPHMGRLISACSEKAPIQVWNAADINVQTRDVGLTGSFTHVIKTFSPDFRRQKEILEGSSPQVVSQLIQRLKKSDTTIAHKL